MNTDLVKLYIAKRNDAYDITENMLKPLNEEIDKLEKLLVDAMIEDQVKTINMDGNRISLKTMTSTKILNQEALITALKESKLDDLIKAPSVDYRTIGKYVREQNEQKAEIPKSIMECLEFGSFTQVSMTKV